MAIDTTHTIQLGPTPVEIVATLGLTPGEYRIENAHGHVRSEARIFFVATSDLLMGTPESGHALAPGAREDIGIETGQRWYFWAPTRGTLVITESEAGGAIGGSPPRIVLPHFYITVYQTAAARPMTPSGGSYERLTSIVTPPTGWSNERTDPAPNTLEMEYAVRALIDPNTMDAHITPVWGAVHLLGEGGTITGVTAVQPLQGGGLHGHVEVRLPARSLETDRYADDSVTLAKLAPGAAGDVIGYDAQGDPASITPPARIEQLDVPPYAGEPDGQLLSLASETPVWADPPVIPRLVEFFYGTDVPTPEGIDDVWYVTDRATGRSGVVEADGVTARTTILRGDIYEWVATAGQSGNGAWVYQANVDSAYGLVTAMTEGLMSAADFVKLTGIESGAEVNVRADWDETDPTADAFVENKPHIPDDQVPADWDEDTSVARILNKPVRIDQFDAPAPTVANNGRVLGVIGGAWALVESGSHRIDLGTNLPDMPASGNLYIFEGAVSGLTGVVESDMMTARTSVNRGDTVRYDGSRWVYLGTVNTEYPLASSSTHGLMSMADFVKLLGIAPGAEANVNADWDSNSGPSRILNRPTIPPAPVNADWDATTGLARVLNKPDIPDDPVQSDWDENDVDAQAYIRNKPPISRLPPAPAAGASVSVYELSVATDGTATWATAFVPGVPTTSVGGTLPASPSEGDLHFMSTVVANAPANAREADGTTLRPSLLKGDAYLYDATNSVWVYQGDVHTVYEEATAMAPGLLSSAGFTKLGGIAAGAEVNVRSDWDEDDSESDAYIENKPSLSQLPRAPAAGSSVAVYELSVGTDGAAQWATAFVPGVPTTSVGGTLPASPSEGDLHFMSIGSDTTGDNVRELDGTTRRAMLVKGDAYRYDATTELWTLQGNLDSAYPVASASVDGLLTAAGFTKLNEIEARAQRNVVPSWTAEQNDPAFIADKPVIPPAQVQSDWNEQDATLKSFIQNRPVIPDAQVNTDWDSTDGPSELLNKPTIPDAQVQSDWSQADDAIISHIRNRPGALVDIGQLDLSGQAGMVLGLSQSGAWTFHDLSAGHGDVVDFGESFPSTPRDEQIVIFTGGANNLVGYQDAAGVARTSAVQGDVAVYDTSLTAWVYRGRVNTTYEAATDAAPGLLSGELHRKLAGIEDGAQVNVNADWNEDDTSSDAYIANRPTIPRLVQSDWDEGGETDPAFIQNKPAIPVLTKASLYAAVKAILVHGGSTGVMPDDANSEIDIEGGVAGASGTRLTAGTDFPPSPNNNDLTLFVGSATGLENYESDVDGSPITTASRGDIARYDGSEAAWVSEGSINTRYAAATQGSDGLLTAAGFAKLDGIEAGAQVNVNPDWDEDDTSSDAYIANRPTIPALTKASLYDAVKAILVHGSSPAASPDDSNFEIDITGVTPGVVTSMANGLMSPTLFDKLSGIAEGAEVNVNADWDEDDTAADSYIANKPTIPTPFSPSASNLYASVKTILAGAVESDDALQTITILGTRARAGQNLPNVGTAHDNDSFIFTADASGLTTYRDPRNNTLATARKGDFAVFRSSARVWVYHGNVNTVYDVATAATDGLMGTADRTKLDGIESGAQRNIQADWDEDDTVADAYIANKPAFSALSFGTSFPSSPHDGAVHFFTGDATGLQSYQDDGAFQRTTAARGDIARYMARRVAWVWQGTLDTHFVASQESLYAAVKAILVHDGSSGIAADDANHELDVTGGGGGGGSSFLPAPARKDVGADALYHGWPAVGGGWLIRRLTYTTSMTTTARQSGNPVIGSLADAWSQRASLSYAA